MYVAVRLALMAAAVAVLACHGAHGQAGPSEPPRAAPAATQPPVHGVAPAPAQTPSMDVLFAPYDNHTLLQSDLAALQACTAAAAAGRHAVVRFAVYNLLDADFVDGLIAAWKQGATVQLLVHWQQLAEPYVPTYQKFKAAGMNVAASVNTTQHNLTAAQLAQLNLVGIDPNPVDSRYATGLMHTKTRLLEWDDESGARRRLVASGSLNPENAALSNDETLLLFRDDAEVYATYEQFYNSTLYGTAGKNEWNRERAMSFLYSKYSGTAVREVIFSLLTEETEAAFIMVYALRDLEGLVRNTTLVEAACAAAQRGVSVVVLTDKGEADGEPGFAAGDNTRTAARLGECGIPTYKCQNYASQYNAMHAKNAVFGARGQWVITDTANWSVGSMGKGTYSADNYVEWPSNTETTVVLNTSALDNGVSGLRFLSNVLATLRKYSYQQACPYEFNNTEVRTNCASQEPFNQPDWTMPTAANVTAQLQAKVPAWPAVSVTLQLTGVPTSAASVAATVGGGVGKMTLAAGADGTWSSGPFQQPMGSVHPVQFTVDGVAATTGSLIVDPAFDWASSTRATNAEIAALRATSTFAFTQ